MEDSGGFCNVVRIKDITKIKQIIKEMCLELQLDWKYYYSPYKMCFTCVGYVKQLETGIKFNLFSDKTIILLQIKIRQTFQACQVEYTNSTCLKSF